jgi:hypothetical protein
MFAESYKLYSASACGPCDAEDKVMGSISTEANLISISGFQLTEA